VIERTQIEAADAMLRSIESTIARTRGGWFMDLWIHARLAAVRIRLTFDTWSSGSEVPAFLFALFIGMAVFGGILLFAAILGLPTGIAATAAVASGGIIFAHLAFIISSMSLDTARREREQLFAHQTVLADLELLRLWKLRSDIAVVRDQVEQLTRYFSNRRNQLLQCEWRHLRGIDFEQFLVHVFEALGYAASTTRATGDQGVDLLAAKGEVRIAIQAKGYAGSVGNEAVQQAFTGMRHYRCNRCAVITNSEFTRSAVELAGSVECLMIDGSRLPQLIAGELL
jgi:HJR/Mrr/RecB family endonuclease